MKLLFRKKYKIVTSTLLVLQLLVSGALPVSAGLFGGGPKIPSAASMLSQMENRYHLNVASIQNQGEALNVADGKKPTPEVTLFFSPTDPRPLEKVTAKAFPMYFSNKETDLYYTWYLKHAGCNLKGNNLALCDRNGDRRITVDDWKIEATALLAQNGFDRTDADYTKDTDNDGYHARAGGDNKVSVPNHCFVNDPITGNNYELGTSNQAFTFTCAAGTTPMCMQEEGSVNPIDITFPGYDPLGNAGTTGPAFSLSTTCVETGSPICSDGGVATCSTGFPRCVSSATDCGAAIGACTDGEGDNVTTSCQHLFPNAPGRQTGDASFGNREEQFWGTNPADPDTADNGSKDEATISGLGQSSFTWNYATGDQVGVAIEGTSMIPTKYDDSSSMIMWALAKKDCPVTGKGSFSQVVRGYPVTILTSDMDINDCLERNLVDPTEGGQAKNLDVSVSATPDNPTNDETTDAAGDIVVAQASISNASHSTSDMLFDWDVAISDNAQFRNEPDNGLNTATVTSDLQALKLLGNTEGVALDNLRLRLNIKNADVLGGRPFGNYLSGGIGYLKFTAKASENFASGIARKGKSDVIVQFTSTAQKISAYRAVAKLAAAGTNMRVGLPNPLGVGICNIDPLDKAACRVVKNEIIGLRINPAGLDNFHWTINGVSLFCTNPGVSSDCGVAEQNHVNFFPVSGDVGDAYTVAVTANDILTGKTITLTRAFHIIAPELSIASADASTAWPKLLGQYKDVAGASFDEISDSIFEGFSGSELLFEGVFAPGFLSSTANRQWTVDGVLVDEIAGSMKFLADKGAADIYNIGLTASVVQPQDIRQALRDTWGISPLSSPEIHFSTSIQVELKEPGFAQGTLQGSKKYLAAIASYIPASVIFSFRILLSVVLMLFTASVLFTLLPEQAGGVSSPRRRS